MIQNCEHHCQQLDSQTYEISWFLAAWWWIPYLVTLKIQKRDVPFFMNLRFPLSTQKVTRAAFPSSYLQHSASF